MAMTRAQSNTKRRQRYRNDPKVREKHIREANERQRRYMQYPLFRQLKKSWSQIYNIRTSIDNLLRHVERLERELIRETRNKEMLKARWKNFKENHREELRIEKLEGGAKVSTLESKVSTLYRSTSGEPIMEE